MFSIVYNMASISKTATGENTRRLGRFCFTTSKSSCIQYGKPCAVKVARTVWKQGKCREASTYAYYFISPKRAPTRGAPTNTGLRHHPQGVPLQISGCVTPHKGCPYKYGVASPPTRGTPTGVGVYQGEIDSAVSVVRNMRSASARTRNFCTIR